MSDYKPLDLGPIIEMEKAATPGPWRRGSLESYHGDTGLPFRRVYRPPEVAAIGKMRDAENEHSSRTGGLRGVWDVEPGKSAAEEANRLGFIEVCGEGPVDDDALFIAHARQYIPALLAEVVRLRREVAWTHRDQGSPLTGEDGICTCPTCQAAALDGWDPSQPLDWKPEAP